MGTGVGDTDGHDPSDPATSYSYRQPIDEARSIFVSTASDSRRPVGCVSQSQLLFRWRMRLSYPSRERVRRGMPLQALLKEKMLIPAFIRKANRKTRLVMIRSGVGY